MQKQIIKLDQIKLVGISARVNNSKEISLSNQINALVGEYYKKEVRSRLVHQKSPGKTFSVYLNYESDFTGPYDYFLGEEVFSFQDQPEDLLKITIPKQDYIKFTNGPGKVPDIIVDIWKRVWLEQDPEIKDNRAYIADFDIFDPDNLVRDQKTGSIDYNQVSIDVFVGIKNIQINSQL